VANHKDAIKRNKQNKRLRIRNRHYRTVMRNHIKAVRTAVDAGDADAAKTAFTAAVSIIQRTASKGVIHRNQAARRVSRLHKAIAAIQA
jgi:small subunit ribosomal protein S20